MSVWDGGTTKQAIARELYSVHESLPTKAFGPTVYPYWDPDYELTNISREDTWGDVAGYLDWRGSDVDFADLDNAMHFFKGVGQYRVGIEAVYTLVYHVWNGKFGVKSRIPWSRIDEIADAAVTFVEPSTQCSPGCFIRACNERNETFTAKSRKLRDASEAFKHMRLEFGFYTTEAYNVEQEKYFGVGDRYFEPVKCGNLVLWRGHEEYSDIMLVTSKAHLDELIGCLGRLANAFDDLARELAKHPNELLIAWELADLQITTAYHARRPNCDRVAKAFHECRAYAQYVMLESVQPMVLVEHERAYKEDRYDHIVDLQDVQKIFQKVKTSFRANFIHIYKWMPPPDYDVTRCQARIKKHHDNPRTSGAHPRAPAEVKELYDRIRAERKVNFAHAYKSMNGEWPAGLDVPERYTSVGPKHVANWEPVNVMVYDTLGKDVSKLIKDKTTVLAKKDDEMRNTRKSFDQDYLLWYLSNGDKIDTRDLARDLVLNHLPEDNYVRIAYKYEAHKEFSRPFYMATPRRRILLSELEGNLATVARHYPGVLMGKGEAATGQMMDETLNPYAINPTVPHTVVTTNYIVMFDLEKWSPKACRYQIADYHDFWANVYGNEAIREMKTFGCDADIINTTEGVRFSYKNSGADLEGFRARMSTCFHADMLATTCRVARERGYVAGKSALNVFIDDGVVRIAAVGEGREAKANALKFLEVLELVYAAAGQTIHPVKVVVSPIGGEILSKFYIHGVRVLQSVKAAMKLEPSYQNLTAGITEELDELFAAAQGAIKDGADWAVTYRRYIEACLLTVHRWDRQLLNTHSVNLWPFMLYFPKSCSGLGIQSVQSLVTSTAVSQLADGLGVINRAGRYYKKFIPLIKKLMERNVVVRDELSLLRDPTRVRLSGPCFVESRMIRSVMNWISTHEEHFRAFKDMTSIDDIVSHAEAVAKLVLARPLVSVPVIERAWMATPLQYVETLIGKFKRSTTLLEYIGRKACSKIRAGNRRDLKKFSTFWARY